MYECLVFRYSKPSTCVTEIAHHTSLSNKLLISSLISNKLMSPFLLCILYRSNSFQTKGTTLSDLTANFTQQIENGNTSILINYIDIMY